MILITPRGAYLMLKATGTDRTRLRVTPSKVSRAINKCDCCITNATIITSGVI